VSRKLLNLGILAHVDAGKTTLTERLLYAAGVIDELGSVDAGTTQTDSLALERQRGITIKSAVVSFAIGDVTVNLIDTPGHPDFIAEVERVLSVLDGAVLVISAVEGVQAQTLLLMRALQRLAIPTLLFVNKIDRPGADDERVLGMIRQRLTPAIVPLGSVRGLGQRAAEFLPWGAGHAPFRASLAELLAEHDDRIMAAYVDDEAGVSHAWLRRQLAAQIARAQVHPVFFGSASTGAGVGCLSAGVAELLPAAAGDADGPPSGTAFKIERGPAGEKIAYVRLFSGTMRTRDQLQIGRDGIAKVTAISVFENGRAQPRPSLSAGQIGKLWGLAEIQIGDAVGETPASANPHQFAPPTLETVVVARRSIDKGRLRVALAQLAEQDPLIGVRQDDIRQEFSVSLYGEVQKEVIQSTLATDFGIDAGFRETTTIHIERPVGCGAAVEQLGEPGNPFPATVGLRIDSAAAGSGIGFRLQPGLRSLPMYVYKTTESFTETMAETVRRTLREGLRGWRVTDCTVTMTHCGYSAPLTTAGDYRKLTPIVLMRALERAGTQVCEPLVDVSLEIPPDAMGPVLQALARHGAEVQAPSLQAHVTTIHAVVAAARVHELQRELPGLTGGEGVLESSFGGYRAVAGTAPARARTTASPLNREEYLMQLAGSRLR
jgi:ribosomal protection tetracycline resistance protein